MSGFPIHTPFSESELKEPQIPIAHNSARRIPRPVIACVIPRDISASSINYRRICQFRWIFSFQAEERGANRGLKCLANVAGEDDDLTTPSYPTPMNAFAFLRAQPPISAALWMASHQPRLPGRPEGANQ